MLQTSLFVADQRFGAHIIIRWPALVSAAHVRQLPGLESLSDSEIEHRIVVGCPFLFHGRRQGTLLFWKADVRDWWERLHKGAALNGRRTSPSQEDARWRGFMSDEL